MQSLWKFVNKPRIDDWSPLAKFYYADEALNSIARRRDPDRCNHLVTKLRQAQDRVLHIIGEMLMIVFPHEDDRACRDFRVKFPDEIIHDNLPGQLWFGAECLAAGSNIMDHEAESEAIRPLAKELTRHLDKMRELLKDQALRDPTQYTDKIKTSLQVFDRLFADFEYNYVSAMVTVKSVKEYDAQLDVAVLFSDSLTRAIKMNYIAQEQIDDCDPNLLVIIRDRLPSLADSELRKLEMSLVTGSEQEQCSINVLEKEIESICDARNIHVGCAPSPKVFLENSADGFGYPSSDPAHIGLAVANEIRKRGLDRRLYESSEDLIHRLFVCIAGVADQLQTNYSADVRKVLKMVLQPVEVVPIYEVSGKTAALPENEEETGVEVRESLPLPSFVGVRWVPDSDCDHCTACNSLFTMVRRRHHCRNCGRIFCARCSANTLSIPELGYDKRVRVCDLCYLYRLHPFPSSPPSQSTSLNQVNMNDRTSSPSSSLSSPSSSFPPDSDMLPSSSFSSTGLNSSQRHESNSDFGIPS
ncbi:FYVE zinc finger domain-containing protein [Ditylenchus destructor]|nr:FYVE zinc finger domain-containing protein [Ditylenchus destructor]